MAFDYRITPLPLTWPGKATPSHARKRAPFKTIETRALRLLEREIRMLGGRNVTIAVDAEARQIRQDGQLRADARPKSAAVVVSFDTKDARLEFPSDRFAFFWSNIDAVARTLEDLRRVDRYGVQQGRQYAGFKALPASTAPTMSVADAAVVIARAVGAERYPAIDIVHHAGVARVAVRLARSKSHPDAGGDPELFDEVSSAKRVLEAHHGASL